MQATSFQYKLHQECAFWSLICSVHGGGHAWAPRRVHHDARQRVPPSGSGRLPGADHLSSLSPSLPPPLTFLRSTTRSKLLRGESAHWPKLTLKLTCHWPKLTLKLTCPSLAAPLALLPSSTAAASASASHAHMMRVRGINGKGHAAKTSTAEDCRAAKTLREDTVTGEAARDAA
eukprot:3248578-Rhodomonas_salina.1